MKRKMKCPVLHVTYRYMSILQATYQFYLSARAHTHLALQIDVMTQVDQQVKHEDRFHYKMIDEINML